MNIKTGQVVMSAAGHDKGKLSVIVRLEDEYAYICDGKNRRLDSPKRKKLKHLLLTDRYLPDDSMEYNNRLRRALSVIKRESQNIT